MIRATHHGFGWRAGAMWAVLALVLLGGAPSASAQDVESLYKAAAGEFHQLRSAPGANAAQWQQIAKRFLSIHEAFASHRRGAHALFSAALSYREAYQAGADPADIAAGVETFHAFVSRYPNDPLADDCLVHIGDILVDVYGDHQVALLEYQKVIRLYPGGDQAELARQRVAALAARLGPAKAEASAAPAQQTLLARAEAPAVRTQPAQPRHDSRASSTLKRVQFLSTLEWTRVILTLSDPIDFRHAELPSEKGKPRRLYLDLPAAVAGPELATRYEVGDAALTQIRLGQADGGAVRVVLDVKDIERYAVKAFDLPRETKIVLDLHAKPQPVAARKAPPGPSAPKAGPSGQEARSLSRALGLKVRTIVLDAGHGGHDPGAVAHGHKEKEITLAIAQELRSLLRQRRPDLNVVMTRDDDRFVTLQRRTEIARESAADLFVSIHINANDIQRFSGVETYFLNLTTDASALEVAARENASTEKQVSDLNAILLDLLRDTNIIESGRLAKTLQTSLVSELNQTAPVKDLGVKQAPFMVLMGSDVPSVLVEAGFITNRDEGGRLREKEYQRRIAEGIYAGLHAYMDEQTIASEPAGAAPSAQAALVRY